MSGDFRIATDQSLAAAWPAVATDIERMGGRPDLQPLVKVSMLPQGAIHEVASLEPGGATIVDRRVLATAIARAEHLHPGAVYRHERKTPSSVIIERVR
jgi:hypothetical protein